MTDLGQSQNLQVMHVPLAELRPASYNPRVMPAAEAAKLRRSVAQWGMVEPLVVRKADHTIIGGHQRLEAARALGLASVPVVYVDVSEVEAKALNLALNKIQGGWDLPRLGGLLEELRDLPDLDETLSGFDQAELEELLAELDKEHQLPPFEESFNVAAEMVQAQREAAPTRVQARDLWELGRHRLLCGDSLARGALERLCEGKPVDLVLTDPPYGIAYQSNLPKAGRRKKPIASDGTADFERLLARALPAIKAVMKAGAVLYWFAGGGGPTPALAKALLAVADHFELQNTLVWDKQTPGLNWRWRYSWEAIIEASVGHPRIWHGGTEKRNVLRYAKAIPQADHHPTPKPVPLLEELIIAAAPVRGRILDPFAGSGSTLIAAERTGRTCLAVELEPRYCDTILARWEALTGGKAQRVGAEAGSGAAAAAGPF